MAAGIWVSVNLVALYGTTLVLWAGPWTRTALASGWLLTVAGGVLAGRSPSTGDPGRSNSLLAWLARLAPHVFVVGILVAVSLLIHLILDNPPRSRDADETVWTSEAEPPLPPTRITETRTSRPGTAAVRQRRDVTEAPGGSQRSGRCAANVLGGHPQYRTWLCPACLLLARQ